MEQLTKLGIKCGGDDIKISLTTKFINPSNIKIGNHVRIDDYCFLSAKIGSIEIGNYIHIARNNLLISGTIILLSDFSTLSNNCSVYGKSDIYDGSCLTNPMVQTNPDNITKGDVIIGKHVIVGSTTVILPNTIINEGAAIGALSFVKGNVEGWNIYCGAPIKKLRPRHKDCIELEKKFLNEL